MLVTKLVGFMIIVNYIL